MLPKTKETLKQVYERCEKKFTKIDNSLYQEYQQLAYEDLDSAMKEESPRWKITKVYQALFLMCNSILIRKLGIYSKNHDCVAIALSFNELIPEGTLNKIHQVLEKSDKLFSELLPKDSFFEEMVQIRIARNKYLYLPNALREVTTPVNKIITEVKELIKILGELT